MIQRNRFYNQSQTSFLSYIHKKRSQIMAASQSVCYICRRTESIIEIGDKELVRTCCCTRNAGHYSCIRKQIKVRFDRQCNTCGQRFRDPRIVRQQTFWYYLTRAEGVKYLYCLIISMIVSVVLVGKPSEEGIKSWGFIFLCSSGEHFLDHSKKLSEMVSSTTRKMD